MNKLRSDGSLDEHTNPFASSMGEALFRNRSLDSLNCRFQRYFGLTQP